MNPPPAKRNPYRSRLRTEQAAATCQLVLDTATRLFVERGYVATSIDSIAEHAGVGRSTVFSAAGGKPWLLKTAYDRAIVGDDDQVPLSERPEVRAMFEMNDPETIVATYVGIISNAVPRVSPIYEVVRAAAAAGVDPEVHQLWIDISDQRLAGAESVARLLKRKNGLKKGLSVGSARDIIWIYNDPGLHHALAGERGWSQTRYRTWLADALRQQLIG